MNLVVKSFIVVMVALVSCNKEAPCTFHYSKYLIEFSNQSLEQNPFLDLEEYVIIQNVNELDTLSVTTNLISQGNRKHLNFWQCKEDSIITDSYWFYVSYVEAYFRDKQSSLPFVFGTKNCPDLYDSDKYSEFFELLVSTNYHTIQGDHESLIRFNTNVNGASECHQALGEPFDQGEFHANFVFGGKTYSNVWYGHASFSNREIQVVYSAVSGLKAYAVDTRITEVVGYK